MVRSINSFSKAGDKEFLRDVGRWNRPSRSMISVFEGLLITENGKKSINRRFILVVYFVGILVGARLAKG